MPEQAQRCLGATVLLNVSQHLRRILPHVDTSVAQSGYGLCLEAQPLACVHPQCARKQRLQPAGVFKMTLLRPLYL